jgi:hypothetical protein
MIFIRRSLVSSFFADMIQQIHSLRASGVISSHRANTFDVVARSVRISPGSLCAVPEEIVSFIDIKVRLLLFYIPMQVRT